MKKVKFEKKLVLNKETIANLNNPSMNNIKGGTVTYTTDCPSGQRTCDIFTILPLNEQTYCGSQPCN